MEARVLTLALLVTCFASLGAKYRSENFEVTASTEEVAQAVAEQAEESRKRLAVEWLGEELKPWYYRCPIHVKDGAMGAGGWTKFTFVPYQNEIHVNSWDMKVQGTIERILDSVIPHEVTHTILATHFRRPLPRWADEGASTLAEHESERRRQLLTLKQVLQTNQAIPLRTLLDMTDYPSDMQKVYTLYAQGYSLTDLLVQQGGRGKFLQFIQTAYKRKNWNEALRTLYGYKDVADLEKRWKEWVMAGSPDLLAKQTEKKPAAAERPLASRSARQTVRAQAPETEDPFLGPESISMDPATPAANPVTTTDEKPRQYALNTQTASDAPLVEGEETVSYGTADQPPREMPEDDSWSLELMPALVTEAITRSRADVEAIEAEEAEPRGELRRVQPRTTVEVRPSAPRPRSPRPRQSEFPQEFRWPSSDPPRLATK